MSFHGTSRLQEQRQNRHVFTHLPGSRSVFLFRSSSRKPDIPACREGLLGRIGARGPLGAAAHQGPAALSPDSGAPGLHPLRGAGSTGGGRWEAAELIRGGEKVFPRRGKTDHSGPQKRGRNDPSQGAPAGCLFPVKQVDLLPSFAPFVFFCRNPARCRPGNTPPDSHPDGGGEQNGRSANRQSRTPPPSPGKSC
jgi:hypothetical protein